MSREDVRMSGCQGKDPLTFEVAKHIAGKGKARNVYRCKFCKAWHVGNTITPKHIRNKL